MPDAIPGRTGAFVGSWPSGMPADGRFYTDLAGHVESLGYDLLFTGDHIFMHSDNADALTVLGAWAASTSRIVLGTGVLLLALRDPAVAAKQLATIDYLTGGRLVVGVGVGGEVAHEWEAMEIPRSTRGARTDEYLALLRELWSGEPVDFRGRFRSVSGVTGSPRPVQPGGPPIWVGGRSDAALRRTARHDGWCAYASSPDRVGRGVARLAELAGNRRPRISYLLFTYLDDDRDRARATAARILSERYQQDFTPYLDAFCAAGDAEDLRARVADYRDAGVDDVLIAPQCATAEVAPQLDRAAEALAFSPA